jgi:signal transduction histidine kinase
VRRRLGTVAAALLGLLLVALMAPLVSAYAEDRTQDVFVRRLTDVNRFAVLAERALEDGRFNELETDLERYAEVYGGAVVVMDANRDVVATSEAGVRLDGPGVAEAVDQALSGSGTPQPRTVWPWVDSPIVLGSPVGRDAQVLGAVVLVAPTDELQRGVGTRLAVLVLAAVAVLAVTAVGVVAPFVRWILRPVRELDDAALQLADGDLGTRVPARAGPPELRHLARSFNRMADHVETSQQQQRDLIADASHQLGNPLTALRLRLENLRAGASPDPEAADEADLALDEADRLNAIVDSLLDLSQVGAGQVESERVDLAARARHRVEMWQPALPGLAADLPGHLDAWVPPGLVDVVLDALLDNAAKFAPDAAVEVTLRPANDLAVLAVRDHGPGLHEDDVRKVGARFFRGRQHQNVSGTGLGLAIVRARVEDCGGSFAVRPAPGGGLEVAVGLPLVRPAPGSSAALPGAGPADW